MHVAIRKARSHEFFDCTGVPSLQAGEEAPPQPAAKRPRTRKTTSVG
jgi:hypothetical protein